MKNDYNASLIVSLIFAVLINMGIICHAASENVETILQDDPEELNNTTKSLMFKHPGWGWQEDATKIESENQPPRSESEEPESVVKDAPGKKVLPEFKRQSNRTGPRVEYREGAQVENNENDMVFQGQVSTGQSKTGPVMMGGTQTNQLPKFEPVSNKRGPVAPNN